MSGEVELRLTSNCHNPAVDDTLTGDYVSLVLQLFVVFFSEFITNLLHKTKTGSIHDLNIQQSCMCSCNVK